MSRKRIPEAATARMLAYWQHRYAAEIAAGAFLVAVRGNVALARYDAAGQAVYEVLSLPAHLRPVADAAAWHHEQQAGHPLGLPLFDRDDPTDQGSLL